MDHQIRLRQLALLESLPLPHLPHLLEILKAPWLLLQVRNVAKTLCTQLFTPKAKVSLHSGVCDYILGCLQD